MRRSTIGALFALGLAALGALAFAVAASGASQSSNGSNVQANSVRTITHTCTDTGSGGGMQGDDMDNDGDTITFSGPTVLWPPNHKYRTVTITASDNDNAVESVLDNDYTTLDTMTASNEPELGMGSGHTLNDANPAVGNASGNETATQQIQLRGERDGRDPTHQFNGRTYTIRAHATFDGSNGIMNPTETCNATFTVRVPHDMGHG